MQDVMHLHTPNANGQPMNLGHSLNSTCENHPTTQFWQHYKNNDQAATLVQNKNDQTMYVKHQLQIYMANLACRSSDGMDI